MKMRDPCGSGFHPNGTTSHIEPVVSPIARCGRKPSRHLDGRTLDTSSPTSGPTPLDRESR